MKKLNRETALAIKALVALVLSTAIFTLETFFPPTYFLAKPVARLVAIIFSPFLNVNAEGTYIIAGGHAVDFVDTCVGMGYVLLISIYLWIRDFSFIKILGITMLVFFINLLRIGFVLAILSHSGLQAAALAHNITYIVFTLIAIGLIIYSVVPLFLKKK